MGFSPRILGMAHSSWTQVIAVAAPRPGGGAVGVGGGDSNLLASPLVSALRAFTHTSSPLGGGGGPLPLGGADAAAAGGGGSVFAATAATEATTTTTTYAVQFQRAVERCRAQREQPTTSSP